MATESKKSSANSGAEPEAAEAPTTSNEPRTAESGDTIRYTGQASLRQITAKEWQTAGVQKQRTVIWNRANNFKVQADSLNKDALELIKSDPNFVRE